ncbi:MAG: hypothetical protein H0T42_14825 [Deltaproteobacteria bacterium]|nr:hypothetical protein [Deltaproteobacteria bacterium]
MKPYPVLAAALLFAGCGDNTRLEGEHYQYVVSELRIAENNAMAREFSLDLNGDKTVDNQLGMIFATLDSFGLGVGSTAREALLRGGLVMLADLQAPALEDTDLAGLSFYLGSDPDPAPCLDPARLETCGQQFLGQAQFSVDDASTSDLATGRIHNGVFNAGVGVLPIEIAIDPGTTIRLDLQGARVRLSQISEDHISGVIAGGITTADLNGIVIPQAHAQMHRIVSTECPKPGGSPPCGCIESDRADTLIGWFDANYDCRIELHEVSRNSLVESLLAPDLAIGRDRLLSFGVAVELTSASFTPPE